MAHVLSEAEAKAPDSQVLRSSSVKGLGFRGPEGNMVVSQSKGTPI